MALLNSLDVSVPKGTLAAGADPTASAASAGGDTFHNSGQEFLLVETGSTATVVTVDSPTPSNFGFTQDPEISVPANSKRLAGPFAPGRFNDENGLIALSYSAATNVKITVFTGAA